MQFLQEELEKLKEANLYRRRRLVQGEQGPRIVLDGRPVVLLSSNSYLGLASHPGVKRAAAEAAERFGCGSSGARLISGNMELHERLERELADFKGTEAALLFNSGYMANVGLLSTLAGPGDVILSDQLNHASIIDGCRLSRAEIKIYPHKDLRSLGDLLAQSGSFRRRLIVTEGLFSMDGDLAPLPEIVELADRYGAAIILDDAHATGVFGTNGRGTLEHFGLTGSVEVQMGTLGKALGCFGAYVAGSRLLVDYLVNKCRTFIFTTALPPETLAASLASLGIIRNEPERRRRLWENVEYLRNGLEALGFNTMGSESQIIPVFLGEALTTMTMSEMLLERGVYAQGIRPPTVPEGSSRLRLTLMATHTRDDLDTALDALEHVGKELRLLV